MATYKQNVGTAVVNYAGDYPGAVEGELWYDSTNKDFKYQYPNVTAAGSWRTGGNLNTARQYLAGAGIYTSTIVFGGSPQGPAAPQVGNTESYNGASWTEVNDMTEVRSVLAGAGTSTSSLAFGGTRFPASPNGPNGFTETWNGTNWTEVNDLNSVRNALGGAGDSNTACLAFGGEGTGSP